MKIIDNQGMTWKEDEGENKTIRFYSSKDKKKWSWHC